MSIDTAWILAAGLAVFVAWLGWTLWRSGRARRPPPSPPVEAPSQVEPPSAPEAEVGARAGEAAATSLAAPGLQPEPSPAPARRAAPRIERVLAVEDVDGADAAARAGWTDARPLALSAAAADALAGAVDAPGRDLSIRFPPGTMLAVAQGDIERMRAVATGHDGASSPVRWLDSVAAGALAAAVLAAQARERHLDALAGEVQEIKAGLAGLPQKSTGHEARLKTLLQDLARYARDARESYESLVGKAPFRERVDDAARRAGDLWRELAAADAASRRELGGLAATARFGEAQVEKACALLQARRQGQAGLALAGRAGAAFAVLRLVLGAAGSTEDGTPSPDGAAVRVSLDADRALRERLRAAEAAAQGDPYVGRGEFEAHRAALRKLLDAAAAEPLVVVQARLASVQAAIAAGFPGPPEQAWDCLLRTGADGRVDEVRLRPVGPARG